MMIWPDLNADEGTRFAFYLGICTRLGYAIPPEGFPLLIGIRGIELWEDTPHTVLSRRTYDDAFILLSRDDSNHPHVREFRGATHPYQKVSRAAPDADLDGVQDVGTIRPGLYHAERLQTDPPKLWIKRSPSDDRVPTDRDTNHDGVVSDAEKAASFNREHGQQVSEDLGDYAREVLFHPGFTSLTAKGTPYSSIGCQTAAIEDVRALAAFPRLRYLLVDAARVVSAIERPISDEDREHAMGQVALVLDASRRDTDPAPEPEELA